MTTFIGLIRQFFGIFVWWVMVAPWEQCIRVRAGKWVTQLGPGPHWKIPILDKAYVQSVRRRQVALPIQTLTTRDGKTVTLSAALGYRIVDLLLIYQTLHHPEGTLETMAMGEIARYVQSVDSADLTPDNILAEVAPRLRLEAYGLGDTEILLTTFAIIRAHRIVMDSMYMQRGEALDTTRAIGAGAPQ